MHYVEFTSLNLSKRLAFTTQQLNKVREPFANIIIPNLSLNDWILHLSFTEIRDWETWTLWVLHVKLGQLLALANETLANTKLEKMSQNRYSLKTEFKSLFVVKKQNVINTFSNLLLNNYDWKIPSSVVAFLLFSNGWLAH